MKLLLYPFWASRTESPIHDRKFIWKVPKKKIYFDNHGIVIEINSKFIYLILITLYIILLKYKKIKKNKKWLQNNVT